MFSIRPVGRAACVSVRPLIRVSKGYRGGMHTRGFLEPFLKRVARPTGFLYARIGLSGAAVLAAAAFFPSRGAREDTLVMVRTELECTLHRLANHVECQLSDVIRELLIESRPESVSSIAWSGARFIETLREIRDGKEGGDE